MTTSNPGGECKMLCPDTWKSNRKRKRGFSLVELLIVIAIIAILAGLLLPALNAAREKGQKIACTGNLRQLGVATMNYLADNDDYYQREFLGDGGGTLTWTYHFVVRAKYTTHKGMLCPVAKTALPAAWLNFWERGSTAAGTYEWQAGNYGINYNEFGSTGSHQLTKTKAGEVKRPSFFLVATEAAQGSGTFSSNPRPYFSVDNYDNWGYRTVYPRHGREVNVLWGDGHVSSVRGTGGTAEQISRSFTKYSSSPLKACTFENNHWTYNGTNAGRWWGQWHRIN